MLCDAIGKKATVKLSKGDVLTGSDFQVQLQDDLVVTGMVMAHDHEAKTLTLSVNPPVVFPDGQVMPEIMVSQYDLALNLQDPLYPILYPYWH